MSKRIIKKIIIHSSATPEGRDVKIEDIRRWHLDRGYLDIGYHYVIDIHGIIHTGRDVNTAGGHCKSHNNDSIGICYVGGVDKKMVMKDTLNDNQYKSLIQLLKDLCVNYSISPDNIYGHRDFAPTGCPSFDVKERIKMGI